MSTAPLNGIPHRPRTPLTFKTWREDESFRDFLRFSFTPCKASLEACSRLLPIALSEERLLDSIKVILLKEALLIYNIPPEHHFFYLIPSSQRWVYKGSLREKAGQTTLSFYGTLVRPIRPGMFCNIPELELLPKLNGIQVP